jgi:hypothetical protein
MTEMKSTMTKGVHMSAGFKGVASGMVEMMATMRK